MKSDAREKEKDDFSKVMMLYKNDVQYGCAGLLLIHIILLVIFMVMHVRILMLYNIFSVLFYAILFSVKKKQAILCMWHVYTEITVFSFLAVYTLGWNSGFQLYIAAMIAVLFYIDYLRNKLNARRINVFIFVGLLTALFIILRVMSVYCLPLYMLESSQLLGLYIMNLVIVTLIAAVFLYELEMIALSDEGMLYTLANKDALTKLDNRWNMLGKLKELTETGQAGKDTGYSVAILDIDDFKLVNDRYGHNAGDYVLREVGKSLKKLAESCGASVCRWGGEEFLMLLNGSGANKTLQDQLKTYASALSSREFQYEEKRITITVTVGIAKYRSGDTAESLINRADEYLYTGKGSGKNIVIAGDR
jgi:diguanylate cyclase